jgi:hypothetical protein
MIQPTAGRAVRAEQQIDDISTAGIDRVEAYILAIYELQHIKFDERIAQPNLRMIERLRAGRAETEDIIFYQHEIHEAELFDDLLRERGSVGTADLRAIHLRTLAWQGIPYERGYHTRLYHPLVVAQYPDVFR